MEGRQVFQPARGRPFARRPRPGHASAGSAEPVVLALAGHCLGLSGGGGRGSMSDAGARS
eukprot:310300-Pyramimonas_sp.AAC.1